MNFTAQTLQGKYVRLEPLCETHKTGLCEAISDGELWKLYVTLVPHPDNIDAFLSNAQDNYELGDGLTFEVIDQNTDKIAGSTRFMKANIPHKRVEIGFTFLGNTWQRTCINSESKLLLLTHAFESMDMNRVEFLTDFLNKKSRNAILRLGAKEEGILRNHMVMPDGRVRDSVLYSIIRHEWSSIKQHLCHGLSQ